MSPRGLLGEARDILNTAVAGTHRALLAWAAGTVTAHAVNITHYARTCDPRHLTSFEYWGSSLARARHMEGNRQRLLVRDGSTTLFTVRWAEAAAILDPVLTRPGLLARCQAAMEARRAHEPYGLGWRDIEEECGAAACAVWAACKPAPAEQLDLFTGLT